MTTRSLSANIKQIVTQAINNAGLDAKIEEADKKHLSVHLELGILRELLREEVPSAPQPVMMPYGLRTAEPPNTAFENGLPLVRATTAGGFPKWGNPGQFLQNNFNLGFIDPEWTQGNFSIVQFFKEKCPSLVQDLKKVVDFKLAKPGLTDSELMTSGTIPLEFFEVGLGFGGKYYSPAITRPASEAMLNLIYMVFQCSERDSEGLKLLRKLAEVINA